MLFLGKKAADFTDERLSDGVALFETRLRRSISDPHARVWNDDSFAHSALLLEQRRRENVAFGLNEAVREVLTATLSKD
jgi:hypothetical protein